MNINYWDPPEFCDDCGARLTDEEIDLRWSEDGTPCDDCVQAAHAQGAVNDRRWGNGIHYACGERDA